LTILAKVTQTETRFREQPGEYPGVAAVWSVAPGAENCSVIPADGCFDLIVSGNGDGGVHAFIHEPVARAHSAVVGADTRVVGVRLEPGYGAALTENADTVRRSAEHWARTDAEVVAFEAIIVSAIEELGGPPNVMRDFIALALDRRGNVRLKTELSTAGERELQRAAGRWLGVTPKAFLRIERARAARSAIREGLPLASVAADLGYADQAHLTREVRDLLGATPRQLRPVGILQDLAPRRP
jgi:AraC-like DNA-binding protein